MWDFKKFEKGNTAVIDDYGTCLTYAELHCACQELSDTIGQRCLVFCLCTNELGSLIGYAGFLNNGIVPALLKDNLDEELLCPLLEKYRPAFVWAPERSAGKGVLAGFGITYCAYGYVLLKTPYGNTVTLYKDLALLLTTSGSTGSPKFVRQSYTNIRANMNSIEEYLQLDSSERPITTLPMHYTYGLSVINTHLDVGAAILLTDKAMTRREFWSFFRKYGATSFGGVPYTYEMLKRLRFFRMELPTLRTMTQAGGKLQPELHREFAEYAAKECRRFIVMYGQCEATARMGYLPPEHSLRKSGSMGIPIPGGRFELIDEKGCVLDGPEKTGELVYYGGNVTLGYADSSEDLSKGDERGGRLETGDLARRDADGFYYIVGRKKRFLKIFGNRINLDDAERMLKSAFSDVNLACGGVDNLLYIFAEKADILPQLKEYLCAKTGLHPSAFRTVQLEAIPHNESGKTIYRELAKYYEP